MGTAIMNFQDVPDYLLAPLAGSPSDAWFAAPGGKWSPAEIIDHLANAMELSAKTFASRLEKPPMARRPRTMKQRVGGFLLLGLGYFPSGRKAPEATVPAARPDRQATEAKLRAACAAWLELQRALEGRADLFVKHPVLGDLTAAEFMRFHVRHAEHHRKQIVERMLGR
jgi:hypothetical protein